MAEGKGFEVGDGHDLVLGSVCCRVLLGGAGAEAQGFEEVTDGGAEVEEMCFLETALGKRRRRRRGGGTRCRSTDSRN